MTPVLLGTFGLIFVAELGDKTQLFVAWLATRFRPLQVMLGVLLGSAAIHLLSAAVGGVIGDFFPELLVQLTAGGLFLAFGLWALYTAESADGERVSTRNWRFPVASIALAFFVAELGDKTQLAALSRAAQAAATGVSVQDAFWGVWIGATLGMLAADGLAVVAGSWLAGRVRHSVLARISGVVFLLFGAYALVLAVLP